MNRAVTFALLFLAIAPHAQAQGSRQAAPAPADSAAAFADRGAAALFNRARTARRVSDATLRSYTAVVRSRTAAGLRMPLKDRTLFRQETAVRVRWSRDAETAVQLLAARVQHPGGVEAPRSMSGLGIDQLFNPSDDRLYFGLTDNDGPDDDDDYWIEHPLGDAAELHYRFTSGDTLTIRLQGDRRVRAIELRVAPRRDDPHTVRGTLWIEAETGALVRAAFRLARTVNVLQDIGGIEDEDRDVIDRIPGFFKPFEFDISLMTVEYSLWEMKHWLPRTLRLEGVARAGAIRFPASTDASYEIEDVTTDAGAPFFGDSAALERAQATERAAARRTAAAWGNVADFDALVADSSVFLTRNRRQRGRGVIMIAPRDSMQLLRSPQLPPPIWSDAPGFATNDELQELSDRISSIAGPPRRDVPAHFGWGLGEAGMLRYNRVEGLSLGARGTVAVPYAELAAVVRFGVADLHPNVALSATRDAARRSLELRTYHELATADVGGAALGLGNSLSALTLGRDAGEYYRASGASLTIAPPSLARRSWELTAYGEYQNDVARNTHIALPRVWQDSVFRANIRAAEALQYGALFILRPWWGTDPRRAQGGIEIMTQAETGDYDLLRGTVTLRGAVPLGSRMRFAVETAAGSSAGDVTPQRLFFIGGARTLRGYEPGTLRGTSMAHGRMELARTASFGSLAVFGDWGWAGDRDHIMSEDQRIAAGVGASLLDGLLRVDLARALRAPRGWRIDMYLDALL